MAATVDSKLETQAESQHETKNESANTETQTNTTTKEPTSEKKDAECTCPVHPHLERSNTVDSIPYDEEVIRSRPRHRATGIHRFSPSPPRIFSEPFQIPAVQSSERLLSQVNKMDGIIDLPYPARTSVYLTTFPFTERDVQKYSWLFANGTEDVFFLNSKGQMDADDDFEYDNGQYPVPINSRRNRNYYDPMNGDIPLIKLSRALDPAVVPEDNTAEDLRYWIVVQHRSRPTGLKLMVAESRKAAGILIYYEALHGNSVPFVGAVIQQRKKGVPLKAKRVESLQDAVKMKEEGGDAVGIVC